MGKCASSVWLPTSATAAWNRRLARDVFSANPSRVEIRWSSWCGPNGRAESIAPEIRAALRAVEPSLPTAEFRTLSDVWIGRSLHASSCPVARRFRGARPGAGLARIYGVVITRSRTHAGDRIRMALGASAGHVQLRVLRETCARAGRCGHRSDASIAPRASSPRFCTE